MIVQGSDASGKDSIIKHVTSGMNPAGVTVISFKEPSREELRHNYLWRYVRALPEQGVIGIFNRSYYEEVCVVRVNPQLIRERPRSERPIDKTFWRDRFEDINSFERQMTRNGTIVLKFFLHLSKAEQKKAPAPATGRPAQAVEVLRQRHCRTRAVGRLSERLRSAVDRNVYASRPLVDNAGRPEVGRYAASSRT